MMVYILANTIIGIAVLLGLKFLAYAPARFRFYLCFSALLCWFIPWGLVSEYLQFLLPQEAPTLINLSSVVATTKYTLARSTETGFNFQVVHAFILASAMGAVWFIIEFVYQQLSLHELKKTSRNTVVNPTEFGKNEDEIELYLVPGFNNAFTSGIIKPKIWLGRGLEERVHQSVLLHELIHVYQKDNLFLLVTIFCQQIFWWNPFVFLLGRKIKQEIELSCDERCVQHKVDYQHDLAWLLFSSTLK